MISEKNFHSLSVAMLFAGFLFPVFARADTTLIYGETGKKENPETGEVSEGVLSAQRLYIRDGHLAMETYGESRVVLFNQAAGTVQLIDHGNKTYADLDAVMVAEMGERLTQTQREVLKGLDKKLAEMPKKDREEMRQLLDDLHKATDQQLSKVPKIRYSENATTSTVGEFEASVVDALENDTLAARYFLVDYKTLGMTEAEYGTLNEFQEFVRRLFEQTPGLLRRHFGDFEMLAKSGRVPVKVDRYGGEKKPEEQKLLNHFNGEIKSEWFEVPDDYQYQSLIPDPIAPGTGA